ncbi:MAG: Fe-S cluster assembly sulfur transfer protein SufU [Bacteroidota bacterium]
MNEKLKQLYQSVILEHQREPFHYQKQENASLKLEAYNPLCGDKFELFLEMKGDRITEAYFFGYGCAISKASSSVLVKRIIGKSLEEVRELFDQFYDVVQPDAGAPVSNVDEELEAFAGARQFPGRLKCATLSWDALKEFIEERKNEGI